MRRFRARSPNSAEPSNGKLRLKLKSTYCWVTKMNWYGSVMTSCFKSNNTFGRPRAWAQPAHLKSCSIKRTLTVLRALHATLGTLLRHDSSQRARSRRRSLILLTARFNYRTKPRRWQSNGSLLESSEMNCKKNATMLGRSLRATPQSLTPSTLG